MAFDFGNQPGGQPNQPGRVGHMFRSASRIVLIVVVLLVVATVGMGAFTVIDEGYMGVKYQMGRIVDIGLAAGLNFKIPFLQTIKTIDAREQMYEATTSAYTKDTQTVENLQVKLNYAYDRAQIDSLIRTVGVENVTTKIIIPQLQSTMKNEIGQVRAEDLVQNRSAIQENIEETLRTSLAKSGVVVTSFAMENIDFEDGFEESIRAKVAAEQQALTMQNKTKEKEELARQQVIEAQAMADSEKIKADAQAYAIEILQRQLATSPEYIQLQQVEKWDGKMPQVMGGDVNPFVAINAGSAAK
ncbi:MAG: prohibitin family protein [Oscillospiraceae bacterium]